MQPPKAPGRDHPAGYPFTGEKMFVRGAWYVVALASEVTDALIARTVLGDPLVLYRDAAGTVVCLEGVCPHRHYPMAHAWKEGDQLRCPYHGMRFGPDGVCTEIPSQAAIPANCYLRAYPAVERWPWVWVWMGEAGAADPAAIPGTDITWLHGEANAYVDEPLHIAARYPLLSENLLDLSHIPYLHWKGGDSGWARGTDWPEEQVEQSEDGRRLRGTRVFDLPAHDLPIDAGLGGSARLTLAMDYYPPTFFVGNVNYAPLERDDPAVRPALRNVHAFTPVNAHETIYYFASARNFGVNDPAVTAHYQPLQRAILQEDKAAAEMIDVLVDRPGRRADFVARADRFSQMGRRMLQRMIDAEGD